MSGGLGSAMAGGNPTRERRENDHYPTPNDVTLALLAVETFEGGIWEPACGDGAMARLIEAAGYKVVGTDIAPQGYGRQCDFFAVPARRPVANIVTNPPFNLASRFIEHGMAFKPRKMALMLKASYWHAATRAALFERHQPARIYPLLWRPDFLGLGRPTMEVMWCIWDQTHTGATLYKPLSKSVVARAQPASTSL